MNIRAIKVIVTELNYLKAMENPENIFEISFDESGDLLVDWQTRKARALLKNLAVELGLDYRADFRIGHTRVEELPEYINTRKKITQYFKKTLEEYVEIAEIFIK